MDGSKINASGKKWSFSGKGHNFYMSLLVFYHSLYNVSSQIQSLKEEEILKSCHNLDLGTCSQR